MIWACNFSNFEYFLQKETMAVGKIAETEKLYKTYSSCYCSQVLIDSEDAD